MPMLHNCVSNRELRDRVLTETEPRITMSFYKYFSINNPKKVRDIFYTAFSKLNVFGRVYLAYEGINAQISIPKKNVENLQKFIHEFDPALHDLRFNIALDNKRNSFWVLRMKVRERIVADGINDSFFDARNVGEYLKAAEVNSMLDDPNVIFIDMRNHYEYEIGHFEKAVEIPTLTFREKLIKVIKMMSRYKDRKIVIYCTGGIRCEKASSWMKYNGFNKVYQVEGGIIEYVRCAREQGLSMRFIGKNFVFDERMWECVSDDIISHCHQCGVLCDTHTNCMNNFCHLLFIQCPVCKEKFKGYCGECCLDEHKSLKEKNRPSLSRVKVNNDTDYAKKELF